MLMFGGKKHPDVRQAKRYYHDVVTVASRGDVPSQLGRTIYVVRRFNSDRWLILACPCGCGGRIEVNLMKNYYPHWRLRRHKDSVSLWPSLWVSNQRCGSHFRLVDNRVLWVVD
jgi:hypothetical protein